MTGKYYRIRIRIANEDHVRMEIYKSGSQLISEPTGAFGFKGVVRSRIQDLQEAAGRGELTGPGVEELGSLLFSALLDEGLKNRFVDLYQETKKQDVLLRVELDVDEQQLPEVAALPWEFIYMVSGDRYGALWLATAPGMVFTRRRAAWQVPEPIRLKTNEPLRIAVAAAAPHDLGPVRFQEICSQLNEMANSRQFKVKVLENANKKSIDELLETKPHIFHFIGHARLKDENRQDSGQVALVDQLGRADLVSATYFSELFNRHRPGLVVLHACETGALSQTRAFVGIASQIIQMNVPAVAAMQFKVSNATATRFSLEFYRRLANKEPVDKAVQEARRDIALGPGGYSSRDFATPMLFMALQEGRLFQWQEDEPDTSSLIEELMEKADKEEKAACFKEARNTWLSIQKLNSRHPGTRESLNRLEEKLQNEGFIKELLAKLVDKIDELDEQDKRLYNDVSRYLKDMKMQGIDDAGRKRIAQVQEFLNGQVSAEVFSFGWGRRGAAIDPEAREKNPDYETIAKLLNRGELIPFLGPGVLPLSGFPVPSSQDMVQKIAENIKCADFKGTLPMVSQFCMSEKKYTRALIIDELRKLMHQEKQPGPSVLLYDMLAGINVPILVVSNSYDDLLELNFCQKGKKFAVVSHHAQPGQGSDFGKLQVQYSDRAAPEKLFTAEEISELELFKNEYSIIYKICGYFNLGKDKHQHAHAAGKPGKAMPMIFEEEFFILSKQLEQFIPDHFVSKFSGYGFLFLGYPLDDWQDRLIAYVILKKWKNSSSSFSVCEKPGPYERTFWKSLLSLEMYRVELRKFIEKLDKHIKIQAKTNGS